MCSVSNKLHCIPLPLYLCNTNAAPVPESDNDKIFTIFYIFFGLVFLMEMIGDSVERICEELARRKDNRQ